MKFVAETFSILIERDSPEDFDLLEVTTDDAAGVAYLERVLDELSSEPTIADAILEGVDRPLDWYDLVCDLDDSLVLGFLKRRGITMRTIPITYPVRTHHWRELLSP